MMDAISYGEKRNIFGKILISLMLAVLSIYPTMFAIRLIVEEVWAFSNPEARRFILCLIALVFIIIIGVMILMPPKINKKQMAVGLVLLFIGSMIPRLFVSFTMQSTPGSDFVDSVKYAMGSGEWDMEFLTTVPYHGAYAIVLKVFMRIVRSYSLVTGQVFNCMITSLIPPIIFFCTKKIAGNAKPAIGAALVYSFSPSMIVYTTMMSPEHVSQFFIALMLLIYIFFAKETEFSAKKVVLGVLFSLTYGIMCIFKELYILFAPVVMMGALCFEIIPAIGCRTMNNMEKAKKAAKILLVYLLILAVAFCVYQGLIYATQVILTGTTSNLATPMNAPIMHNIYRGLSVIARGSWNAEVNEIADGIYAKYKGTPELNGAYLKQLYSEYEGRAGEFWKTIEEKIFVDWCKEGTIFWWSSRGDKAIYAGTEAGNVMFRYGPMVYLLYLYVFSVPMAWHGIGNIWKKNEASQVLFYILGTIFLFVLMLTLMECQSRYKSNMMPLLSCVWGIGLWKLGSCANAGVCWVKRKARR